MKSQKKLVAKSKKLYDYVFFTIYTEENDVKNIGMLYVDGFVKEEFINQLSLLSK